MSQKKASCLLTTQRTMVLKTRWRVSVETVRRISIQRVHSTKSWRKAVAHYSHSTGVLLAARFAEGEASPVPHAEVDRGREGHGATNIPLRQPFSSGSGNSAATSIAYCEIRPVTASLLDRQDGMLLRWPSRNRSYPTLDKASRETAQRGSIDANTVPSLILPQH